MSVKEKSDTAPRVSVVMAIYKEPVEWMRQAIDSILNQTFNDFELIIINDNPSRSENKDVLEEYSAKDSRIIVIENEENIGLTKSLNRGLNVAKGEFIARMDADDISEIDRFENQLSFFELNPEYDFCATSFSSIDENGITLKKNANGRFNDLTYLYRMNPIGHSTVMFRSSLLELRTPLYNELFRCEQDVELWSVFLINNVKMYILPECLVKYRLSSQQISNKKKSNREYSANSVRNNLIFNYINNKQSSEILNTSKCLQIVERDFKLLFKENPKVIKNILFTLYYSLTRDSFFYRLRYIFSRNLYLFRLHVKDSLNILFR